MENLDNRKKDHIELAFQSLTGRSDLDRRFHYEPLLHAHPKPGCMDPVTLLGREHRVPMWVSSMTGGTKLAGTINRNLAMVCNEFGFGMGLGSCRILLEDDSCFEDFNMRDILGDHLPLWANLGIAQVEELLERNLLSGASDLVKKLRADGLIVHVNPLQEWFQPEGNILRSRPIDIIRRLLDRFDHPVIVKEVGQGMGPESLRHLLRLPLQAIEFAAFGGTNFSKAELFRNDATSHSLYEPLSKVGEDVYDMLDYVNEFVTEESPACKEVILSGGIRDFLDGYYLTQKSVLPALYGMASGFLRYAREGYDQLRDYVHSQVRGLELAHAYLTIRE